MSLPFLAEVIGAEAGSRELGDAHRRFLEWRRSTASLGPASSLRALAEVGAAPLARVLHYEASGSMEVVADVVSIDLFASGRRVPCLIGGWGHRLDRWRRVAVAAARTRDSRWALLFNGTHLQVTDATGSQAQRGLTFDLTLAAADVQCFSAIWIATRAETTLSDPDALAALVARADEFAAGVCRSLRHGVLDASSRIVSALFAPNRGTVDAAFEQALTVVFRMLFLLFAESRGLVPTWHPIYRHSYSIDCLRTAAERGRRAGLWDAFRAICRLAHAGCRFEDLTVTPFNGRLFDAARVPLIERRDLDDEAAQQAILALTTRAAGQGRGREPISYRDLGVEQLGAIYETLLDYAPRTLPAPLAVPRPRSRRTVVVLERGSTARKASGAFYTPQPIAQFLVAQTLGPLVSERRPDDILSLKVLDPASGSGAFLVAACLYLAAAYEDALVATGACLAEDIGHSERAAIRRLVAERCLYGVDLNPTAVQLTRLSLWLTTLAGNKPLSFLDHHIRSGDSLAGAWLTSLARPPAATRRRGSGRPLPLFDEADFTTTVRDVVPVRFSLAGPNDTLADVRAKERALSRLERPGSVLSAWRRVADLWCAHWFATSDTLPSSAFHSLAAAVLTGRGELPSRVAGRFLDHAARIAAERRFLHWELEFPEVFFDVTGKRRSAGGFDAIVGNPPWDMMRADAGGAATRREARRDLGRERLFVRDSGNYVHGGAGQDNRYQLFVERSVSLLRCGGRLGLVLPGGLATDQGSNGIRRLLFSRCEVDGVIGFDNRRAIFPIHRSVRFLLLTATNGRPTHRLGLRLGETDPAVLREEDSGRPAWYRLHVTTELLERLSGDGLAIPALRTPRDLAIAERACALFPPLGAQDGWDARFSRELNATDDRGLFDAPGRGVPVVEGKVLEPFRVRLTAASRSIDRSAATRRLGERWQRPRLAYRDVSSATNRLTLIAALLPAGTVSTHTVFCLRNPLPLRSQYFLCGLFNSLVVNYLVRLRVASHVTTDIVRRLPIPRNEDAPAAAREIAAIARRLTRGRPAHRAELLARLNARVARLYQLSRDEFAHVLGTFPLVPAEDRRLAFGCFDEVTSGEVP